MPPQSYIGSSENIRNSHSPSTTASQLPEFFAVHLPGCSEDFPVRRSAATCLSVHLLLLVAVSLPFV